MAFSRSPFFRFFWSTRYVYYKNLQLLPQKKNFCFILKSNSFHFDLYNMLKFCLFSIFFSTLKNIYHTIFCLHTLWFGVLDDVDIKFWPATLGNCRKGSIAILEKKNNSFNRIKSQNLKKKTHTIPTHVGLFFHVIILYLQLIQLTLGNQ